MSKQIKPKKSPQELLWVEDLLPYDEYDRKSMFGGFAYYYNSKMILLTFEDSKTNSYKKIKLNYPIWHGCLFPVERENHQQILRKFSALSNHPVLPKWLYLPSATENFEEEFTKIIKHVLKNTDIWGIIPKSKKKKTTKTNNQKMSYSKVNMSQPQMFREERSEVTLQKAEKITDLKNLGPASEKILNDVGIKTGQQLLKIGWKKAFIKLVDANPKNLHLIMAKVLIGATTNKEWFRINPDSEQEAKDLVAKLRNQIKKPKK